MAAYTPGYAAPLERMYQWLDRGGQPLRHDDHREAVVSNHIEGGRPEEAMIFVS
jgi:hypothetical protein